MPAPSFSGGPSISRLTPMVSDTVARRTFSCPHCGLGLTIDDTDTQGSTSISYDPAEWRRLCQYPDLDSPALCLLEGGDGAGRDTPPNGDGRQDA